MTRNARFKREVRARMARTGEAYTAARAQLMQGERTGASPAPDPSKVLQITNGDSAAQSLQSSGIEGDVLSWRDVLHDGPVPGGLAAGELRGVRAEYLATRWHLRYDDVLRDFTERDDIVQRHRHGRYVLWFEADLYDQLQLIQVRKHPPDLLKNIPGSPTASPSLSDGSWLPLPAGLSAWSTYSIASGARTDIRIWAIGAATRASVSLRRHRTRCFATKGALLETLQLQVWLA